MGRDNIRANGKPGVDRRELGCTQEDVDALRIELDAITELADLGWIPDDPLAVTVDQWSKHSGLCRSSAQRCLEIMAAEGKMRMDKRRRMTADGKWRVVKTWKRI